MIRRYFLGFAVFGLIAGAVAYLSSFLFQPTADTYLLLAALVALIVVARPSPAPFRSFWHRLMARTRDPVPSTT